MNIKNRVSEAGLYEQLAEEAVELAHAAMKMARKLRAENPTPMSVEDISAYIKEEFSDVVLCAQLVDVAADLDLMAFKQNRWNERLASQKEVVL